MKRVIRRSCFESNSSSQHVILITKNDTHINKEEFSPDYKEDEYSDECIFLWKEDGSWHLRDVAEGFGRWPFQMLTTFKEKFRYALCEYCGRYYGDEEEFDDAYHELENLAKEIVPGLQKLDVYTKYLDIYKDQDGNELLYKDLEYECWDKENDRDNYSYKDSDGNKYAAILDEENCLRVPNIGRIDHQSVGLLKNFLKDKGISLKEFLTNKRYVLVIDGDELLTLDRYIRAGLIDKNFILETYSTTDDDVEYLEWLKEQEETKDEADNT